MKGTDSKGEMTSVMINPLMEQTVKALNALSPQNQELMNLMVRQLAEREGISMGDNVSTTALESPAQGIPLWVAKMKQEGYSKRTVETYLVVVNKYLREDPNPTRLSIQQALADKLERLSSARVAIDRKALRSLFSFLYEEGLWHVDPTVKIKSIRVRYRSKDLPSMEDIQKILGYACYRLRDTQKFRTMTAILVTTGLRISEACGIEKRNIDLKRHELKVIGKGGKEGMIPLLPMTMSVMWQYMQQNGNDTPYLFPGDTPEGYCSISSFEKTLRHACAKQGIKPFTPHQLRHFYATYMLRNKVDLKTVSTILRHASVAITADIYQHVDTDELHEAAGKFAPFGNEPIQIPELAETVAPK